MGDEQPEDPGQGGGGDLELQHVVVPLPLDAAWEVALEELLHIITAAMAPRARLFTLKIGS